MGVGSPVLPVGKTGLRIARDRRSGLRVPGLANPGFVQPEARVRLRGAPQLMLALSF